MAYSKKPSYDKQWNSTNGEESQRFSENAWHVLTKELKQSRNLLEFKDV